MSNKANRNPVSDLRWRGRSYKKGGKHIADLRDKNADPISNLEMDSVSDIETTNV